MYSISCSIIVRPPHGLIIEKNWLEIQLFEKTLELVSCSFIVAINNENFVVWFVNDFIFNGFSNLISVISLTKEAAAVVDIYGCSILELYSIANSFVSLGLFYRNIF